MLNNITINVAQREYSNNKFYPSAFKYSIEYRLVKKRIFEFVLYTFSIQTNL